jgi:hypothetical protein
VVTLADWHDELVLMSELSSVNNQIARFVLRLLDVDAGRAEPVSTTDEGRLGTRLIGIGRVLQDRAVCRARALEKAKLAIEVPSSIRHIEPDRNMATAGGKPEVTLGTRVT